MTATYISESKNEHQRGPPTAFPFEAIQPIAMTHGTEEVAKSQPTDTAEWDAPQARSRCVASQTTRGSRLSLSRGPAGVRALLLASSRYSSTRRLRR